MKKIYFTCIILLILYAHSISFINANENKGAVSYELNGGRFADNLRSLSNACWFAYTNDLDVLFKKFKYSEQLVVHHEYPHYSENIAQQYAGKKVIKGSKPCTVDLQTAYMYILTFYVHASVNWNDPLFLSKMQYLIAPNNNEWHPIDIPQDMLSIAIHIRRGGGFRVDSRRCKEQKPKQFPSMSYYADALHIVLKQYPEKPLYVHIFTDDTDPKALVKILQDTLSETDKERVTFEHRQKDNNHSSHVLEDFFNMMRFTCLIRPESGFSRFVQRLGHNEIILVPNNARKGKPWGIVSEITIKKRKENGWSNEHIKVDVQKQIQDSQKTTVSHRRNRERRRRNRARLKKK